MDVREKLVELQSIITCPNAICNFCEHFKNKDACEKHKKEVIADNMIANGVTVQELDGCEHCKEDNDGCRKMLGAFSITNPFHGNVWNIETCHCKPRQIYFCPMCGRKLPSNLQKENDYG